MQTNNVRRAPAPAALGKLENGCAPGRRRRCLRCCAAVVGVAAWLAGATCFTSARAGESNGTRSSLAEENPAAAERAGQSESDFTTKSLQGRVVWMAEAMARRYGVNSMPEARERLLALESPAGLLRPIVEDVRGRSFRLDERLRDVDLELLVRSYDGSPMIQVIRIFALEEDGKYELDYWCEICAIAMFELKPCDCCQQPIELRRRPVER